MSAPFYNLDLSMGVTFDETWTMQDETGQPVNLSGCVIKLQVRQRPWDAAPVISLSSADGSLVVNPTEGTLRIVIPKETTATFTTWKRGVYDLVLTDPTGKTYKLVQGQINIAPTVTR